MKHLLNGVAIAAALAIAAPALAQTSTAPMTPSKTAPAATAPSAMAEPMKPAAKAKHRRPARHMARRGRGRAVTPDTMANQLNQQELARIQSGGSAGAPPPGGGGGAGQGGPRPSGR